MNPNKILSFFLSLLFIPAISSAQTPEPEGIQWMSWTEAVALNRQQPKKIFVDVYTEWCGWCKKMDKTTFQDPQVIAFMNANFYAVKFDAESKTAFTYDNHEFTYLESGSRGIHAFAYALLGRQQSYPSYVYMNQDESRIAISPGFKEANAMLLELQFIAGNHFEKMSFEEFAQRQQP
jgi:thioredoxin-related protein